MPPPAVVLYVERIDIMCLVCTSDERDSERGRGRERRAMCTNTHPQKAYVYVCKVFANTIRTNKKKENTKLSEGRWWKGGWGEGGQSEREKEMFH